MVDSAAASTTSNSNRKLTPEEKDEWSTLYHTPRSLSSQQKGGGSAMLSPQPVVNFKSLDRVRGVGNKSFGLMTSSHKKSKLETLPKMELFILLQGTKVPTSAVIKRTLAQTGQYIQDFLYFDVEQHSSIDQKFFEYQYLMGCSLAEYFNRSQRKYTFYHQKGKSFPVTTGYSSSNFPTLEVWKDFAKDSVGLSNTSKTCYATIVCPFDSSYVEDEIVDEVVSPRGSLLSDAAEEDDGGEIFITAPFSTTTSSFVSNYPSLLLPSALPSPQQLPQANTEGAFLSLYIILFKTNHIYYFVGHAIVDLSVDATATTQQVSSSLVTKCSDATLNCLELFEFHEPVDENDDENSKELCPVCLKAYEEDDLPTCGHTYHATCIRKWLKKLNKCPKCKSIVVNTIEM